MSIAKAPIHDSEVSELCSHSHVTVGRCKGEWVSRVSRGMREG